MNILFFYRIYPEYGGVEVVTTVLANQMASDGNNVTIVSFEQPHMELTSQLVDGINLIKLEYPVFSIVNVNRLHQILLERNIDVIVNQWGLPFKTTMLCKKAICGTNCKLVSVLHGSPYTSKVIIKAQDKYKQARNIFVKSFYYIILFVKQQIVKWSIRYNVRNNSRYVLLSKAFVNPLINYAHISNAQNVIAIGNPITIKVDLNNYSIDNKKNQILYVGRMDYENKRVNRIVETWERVYKDFKEWELVLVGDGPHKSELIMYVKTHNIDRVRFEDFRKEPPINFYKDAKIFMLTSDLEGFGLVVIESMAYGVTPIVYGSYEAIYDIIDNGVNGFVTPKPYNAIFTEEKLRLLLSDKNLCKNMGLSAMEKARKFTLDSVINQWYAMFNDINS